MKVARLILIGLSLYTPSISRGPDIAIPFSFRFHWGKLPSAEELADYLGARTDKQGFAAHWSDWVGRWRAADKARKDLSLIAFCEPYKTIELWFDQQPMDGEHAGHRNTIGVVDFR